MAVEFETTEIKYKYLGYGGDSSVEDCWLKNLGRL